MIHHVGPVSLRKPEPADVEALYAYKNDADVANALGGFGTGYSRRDIADWIERHCARSDEIVWVIASNEGDRCLGHVGLYDIDHRIRSAEFAILIGDASSRGKGLGKQLTRFVVSYGFDALNLNRVHLSLLATNQPALALYRAVGFRQEGVLRQAQYKQGSYVDVVVMSLLREEAATSSA